MSCCRFSTEAFLVALAEFGRPVDREVVHHRSCDSTSTELRKRIADGAAPGTVVVADSQTSGRGRQGRSWHSPEGNLYISIAIELCGPAAEKLHLIPLAAGVAAAEVARNAGAEQAVIKWPNDITSGRRKLAGILCEAIDPRARPLAAIAGLGLNVGSVDFPPELGLFATSLALETGEKSRDRIDESALAAGWVARLESWIEMLERGESDLLIQRWRELSEKFGRRVKVDGIEGVSVGLDRQGRLLVRLDDGETAAVSSGAVEYCADQG